MAQQKGHSPQGYNKARQGENDPLGGSLAQQGLSIHGKEIWCSKKDAVNKVTERHRKGKPSSEWQCGTARLKVLLK